MIKDEEFQRISGFMKQRYGIDLSKKKVIVNGRLENYIRGGGFQSFDEFMNAVENDASGNQEKMLVNYLTTNHTYFMREFEHFDFFKNQVLPWLKQKERLRKDLRIWCGAASSGEEPYMIAMVLAEFFGIAEKTPLLMWYLRNFGMDDGLLSAGVTLFNPKTVTLNSFNRWE